LARENRLLAKTGSRFFQKEAKSKVKVRYSGSAGKQKILCNCYSNLSRKQKLLGFRKVKIIRRSEVTDGDVENRVVSQQKFLPDRQWGFSTGASPATCALR
jgi:ribosomal protein L20A (L18A)